MTYPSFQAIKTHALNFLSSIIPKGNQTILGANAWGYFGRDGLGSRVRAAVLAASLLISGALCHAITILPGLSITNSPNAPLSTKLILTTDVPSRVSVSMTNGSEGWNRQFYDYATNHTVLLYGFKPSRTNALTITVYDRYWNSFTNDQSVLFVTGPLPSDLPKLNLLVSQPDRMEPGYTLFRVANQDINKAYLVILDKMGEVVWYSPRFSLADVRQLDNGDLFLPLSANFIEYNLFGDVIKTWTAPNNLTVDLHDGVPTSHGTILYINDTSRGVANFPTSSTDPYAPTADTVVMYNRIVEISATNSSLLKTWSPIDKLDPTRIDYLTFTLGNALGIDCEHANAVIEDPRDNSIIVSMRHQDAVIKFDRATGNLKWILGNHENWGPQWQPYLLTPVGSPFQWQYGQHAPVITPQGTLLLYDDGNFRASPFDAFVPDANNYSRAVEYDIDETTMEVSQVWDFGRTQAEHIFTDRVGNADWLPQVGNVLITYGYVVYDNGVPPSLAAPNASMVRIQEVTHDTSEVVFDLTCFDYSNSSTNYHGTSTYRSHRIPDLYGHLPQPVQDLTLVHQNDQYYLQFSADPLRMYTLQASTDLVNWAEIGAPETDGEGTFSFHDLNAAALPRQYYRVLSH